MVDRSSGQFVRSSSAIAVQRKALEGSGRVFPGVRSVIGIGFGSAADAEFDRLVHFTIATTGGFHVPSTNALDDRHDKPGNPFSDRPPFPW